MHLKRRIAINLILNCTLFKPLQPERTSLQVRRIQVVRRDGRKARW